MKDVFKKYLFTKHVLVADCGPNEEISFNTLIALKNKLGIKITKGMKLANFDMIEFAADQLGVYIPAPFYRNFPKSVKQLSSDQLLFDQAYHYFTTYGNNDFSEAGHSVFEETFERLAFNENTESKDFVILNEEEATKVLRESVLDLLKSSRPLSDNHYAVVYEALKDYDIVPDDIPCKQTVARLMYDTKNVYRFAKYLWLADVIKVVDYINYSVYGNDNLKKLNMKNKDRKLITNVINACFDNKRCIFSDCFEKRKIWCGLLHHIHYKPFHTDSLSFVKMIRSGANFSAYSRFEKAMKDGNVSNAAQILSEMKGTSVLLRNLNYILSRCKTEEEVREVLSWVK